MVFNKFAAGRKVYGQGATSPTRGTVDPGGYIRRELARQSQQRGVSRVGNDGQSDTRSGLAHNAIRNNLGNNVGRTQQTPIRNPGGPRTNMPSYVPQVRQAAAAPVGAVGGVGVSPAQPTGVQVSANGQLDLPYDSAYFGQVLGAQQNFDNEMMNLGFEEQDQGLQYQQFMRDLEESYGERQRETLNDSAARGTLFSTQYSTGVNNDARQYTKSKTDAETSNTNFLSQLGVRRGQAQSFFNQLVQQAAAEFADRMAANAGNLGYGQDAAPAVVPGEVLAQHAAFAGAPLSQWNGSQWTGNWGHTEPARPPKPGPGYTWNDNKNKWVKK